MLHPLFPSTPLLRWVLLALALWALWALSLGLLKAWLRSARGKGQRGEWRVRRMLRRGLNRSEYVALHNITLATTEGSTQLDHVVLSRFGIFVIETKNMQGSIAGSERQAQWTQHIHQRSFQFQNPLHQNYQHTQALQATLQVPRQLVHSVVAFVGRSHLPAGLPANVTQGAGCVPFIRSFTQPVLAAAQVHELVQQLQARRLPPTRATHRAHVQQLQKRHSPPAQPPATPPFAHPLRKIVKKRKNLA